MAVIPAARAPRARAGIHSRCFGLNRELYGRGRFAPLSPAGLTRGSIATSKRSCDWMDRRVKPGDDTECLAYDDFGLIAIALIGTSTMPRLSTALAHCAMRSIDAGSAVATPTAVPRSRASASRRVSARSMLTGVGTESSTMSALANGRLLALENWPARLRGEEPSST